MNIFTYYSPEEKCLLRFVAGPSILNVSSGLIHRVEFIYKLILDHDIFSLTDTIPTPHLGNCFSPINIVYIYVFVLFRHRRKV